MATIREPSKHDADHAANRGTEKPLPRAALRREKIAAREAVSAAEHARLSALLEAHLEDALAQRAPGVIAFCWPVRGEFDARALVARLLARGWRAAMPVVVRADAPMVFRPWTPSAPMAADPYGIPIPAGAEISAPPDVVLVPLVAFDARGFRLGYGGGYFDRTLAALTPAPATFGVGFELSRTAHLRPEPHDVPLDAIVTETGCHWRPR
jgi:5-formyltetrahydrofolate cyclo-ligase